MRRLAALASVAVTIAIAIALWMDWEKPYWAAFGVIMISLATTGQSLNKGVMRILGTLVAVGQLQPATVEHAHTDGVHVRCPMQAQLHGVFGIGGIELDVRNGVKVVLARSILELWTHMDGY